MDGCCSPRVYGRGIAVWLAPQLGPTVELLEPEELRPRFRELVRDIIKKYNGDV